MMEVGGGWAIGISAYLLPSGGGVGPVGVGVGVRGRRRRGRVVVVVLPPELLGPRTHLALGGSALFHVYLHVVLELKELVAMGTDGGASRRPVHILVMRADKV